MFDPLMVRLIGPPINWAARNLAQRGITANSVTVAGFLIGLGALPALAFGAPTLALILVLLNRVADGLDGAIARATQKTDFGAYLDIVLDFIFYAAVALGFAFLDRDNAIVVAVLIASFIGTGASFLAFAVIAAKRGLETAERGKKSFFYSGGLAEGTETIVFFAVICAKPDWFIPATTIFIAMCWITVAMRINQARVAFKSNATR